MRLEASGGNNRRALPLPLAGEGRGGGAASAVDVAWLAGAPPPPQPAALYRARRPPPQAGEVKRIRGQTDSIKNHPALDPVTRPSSAHPSSALSTSARDGPACPSSDGGDRRCCPLPPPVRRGLSPA